MSNFCLKSELNIAKKTTLYVKTVYGVTIPRCNKNSLNILLTVKPFGLLSLVWAWEFEPQRISAQESKGDVITVKNFIYGDIIVTESPFHI